LRSQSFPLLKVLLRSVRLIPSDASYRLFYMTPMNAYSFRALRLLADGEFRSGEAMAQTLRVSRATVWNALHGFDEVGLEVFKVRGRGYRLAQPLTLLDVGAVARELGAHAQRFALEMFDCAESTNTLMMQRAAAGAASGSVIAAEWQIGRAGAASGMRRRAPHSLFQCCGGFAGCRLSSGLSLAAGTQSRARRSA
jgi:BirA family biotin operon repressor/biotin-[acetyl-CoA-carboxylase] ligase